MRTQQFWKLYKNLRPLQVYKLNDKEAFSVGKINFCENKVYGSVIPLEYYDEKFVIVLRAETLNLDDFNLKLLKDFKGYWDGRYWE